METVTDSKFLYVTSRQFPFDEVCDQIIRELEKRNWRIPGLQIEYGNSCGYWYVRTIKSDEFKIWFCRTQGELNERVNNIAAPTEIIIPKNHLTFHEDESGPAYYYYVGKNWKKDRKGFMNETKVHSKLKGRSRTYLCYKGAATEEGGYTYRNKRMPYLVHDSDLGREYSPTHSEPKFFVTEEVFTMINSYLKEHVLSKILSVPV